MPKRIKDLNYIQYKKYKKYKKYKNKYKQLIAGDAHSINDRLIAIINELKKEDLLDKSHLFILIGTDIYIDVDERGIHLPYYYNNILTKINDPNAFIIIITIDSNSDKDNCYFGSLSAPVNKELVRPFAGFLYSIHEHLPLTYLRVLNNIVPAIYTNKILDNDDYDEKTIQFEVTKRYDRYRLHKPYDEYFPSDGHVLKENSTELEMVFTSNHFMETLTVLSEYILKMGNYVYLVNNYTEGVSYSPFGHFNENVYFEKISYFYYFISYLNKYDKFDLLTYDFTKRRPREFRHLHHTNIDATVHMGFDKKYINQFINTISYPPLTTLTSEYTPALTIDKILSSELSQDES